MAHGSQTYQRRTGEADGTVRIQGGREGTRLEMKVQEVKQSLETAFIDGTINSNLAYQPEFISNDYKQGKKVLVSLEKELKKCDEFFISVAFIKLSGITPLLMILKELEKKGIPGKIITTDYQLFTEPKALDKLASLKNIFLVCSS